MATDQPTGGTEPPEPGGRGEQDTTRSSEAVTDLLLRAGHTQIAAMTAASRFWASWAQSADRYAQSLGTEICNVLEGRTASDEAVTRFADAAGAYLRELVDLPSEAVAHFNEQIDKEPRNRGPRTRRARAKE